MGILRMRAGPIAGSLAFLAVTAVRAGDLPVEKMTVSCTVTDLTICKHDYCARMPPSASGPVFTFDFDRHTYTLRALDAGDHAMEQFHAVHTEGWKKFEFVVRLASGPANVTFDASSPAFGPVQMTAASVAVYEQDPSMRVIDGMRCEPSRSP